jgi:hypothetical protein
MQLRKFFGILILLIPSTGFAFFNVLDRLQEELSIASDRGERQPITLNDLIATLEEDGSSVFSDVDRQGWYLQYVSLVSGWGIVSGYRDQKGKSLGLFGPGDPVTIAEILKMALRAAGVDETQCGGFAMHPKARDHWSARYVACAEEKKMRIVKMYPDLDRAARRAEVIGVIHDAFGDDVLPLLSTFSDTIDHDYEADIAYAAVLGIVSGDTDVHNEPIGTFRPDENVNRAEAAKIIVEKLRVMARLSDLVSHTVKNNSIPDMQNMSSATYVGIGDAIVRYTDDGYDPQILAVPLGTTVIFRNESSQTMWTASDTHPSHELYPNSGIQKCLNPEEISIFDSCEGVSQGSEWSFQFEQNGSWGYHNHLYPSQRGTIEVQ